MVKIADGNWDEPMARVALSALAEPDDFVTGRTLARTEDGLRETVAGLEVRGFGIVIPGDGNWPPALADLGERAPNVLWTSGASSFLTRPSEDLVTVTGARAPTGYGEFVTTEMAADLSLSERWPSLAGRMALKARRIGWRWRLTEIRSRFAAGVDRFYPQGHAHLLDRVRAVGLLASELPPGAAPTKWRFLARNRLLAALSSATVVVAARYRSGSLHIAASAAELGRAVGAVPGPVTSAASAGTHRLLKEGIARVITSADDIWALIAPNADRQGHSAAHPFGTELLHRPTTPRPPNRSL